MQNVCGAKKCDVKEIYLLSYLSCFLVVFFSRFEFSLSLEIKSYIFNSAGHHHCSPSIMLKLSISNTPAVLEGILEIAVWYCALCLCSTSEDHIRNRNQPILMCSVCVRGEGGGSNPDMPRPKWLNGAGDASLEQILTQTKFYV